MLAIADIYLSVLGCEMSLLRACTILGKLLPPAQSYSCRHKAWDFLERPKQPRTSKKLLPWSLMPCAFCYKTPG